MSGSGAYKRVLMLAPFFNSDMNANRPLAAARVLSKMAPVDVVTTDFDHWTKQRKRQVQVDPIEKIYYLKTQAYRKNTGFGRLLSHLLFAVKATLFFRKHRDRYDILYVTLPLNTLAWAALKCAGERWKLIDVTDIWPDVLPFPRWFVRLFRPVLGVWRKFFDRAVAKADVMMTVSDSFFKETSKFVSVNCRTRRFYLSEVNLTASVPKEDILTVAYSGNLGRLYDFETILDVFSEMEKGSVQLFIVGDGDRREWLLNELKRRGLVHRYFGSVYDQTRLADILPRAHLGFNGFVNTSAAFSTKASTYFAAGLPILNSMEGDLRHLVSERELGLNYVGGDRVSLKNCFSQLDALKIRNMSQNCARFFAAELERDKVSKDMLTFLKESMKR